ncbi:acyl-CoA thioesterase [Gephyromycinifex aptenodytis]|uniref:acyl-CoA thioesterase n=1 Tax=Gephyromycinifex aptenodytis TaxID=2716227 RepID=UPI00144854EF|nr:thioesterase family protein [Gephyromycinifex aptenodytis]
MSTPAPYTVEIPLRWSDMDAYAHVNNVQFLRLLEDARVIGLDEWFGDSRLLDRGVLVLRHEIDYLRPLVFRPAPVAVDMWVTQIGTASFDLGYTIRDPEQVGTTCYARAETTLAAFDIAGGHPRRLSTEEVVVLAGRKHQPPPMRSRTRRAEVGTR